MMPATVTTAKVSGTTQVGLLPGATPNSVAMLFRVKYDMISSRRCR